LWLLIATQKSLSSITHYPLRESQLDRFLDVRIKMAIPRTKLKDIRRKRVGDNLQSSSILSIRSPMSAICLPCGCRGNTSSGLQPCNDYALEIVNNRNAQE